MPQVAGHQRQETFIGDVSWIVPDKVFQYFLADCRVSLSAELGQYGLTWGIIGPICEGAGEHYTDQLTER